MLIKKKIKNVNESYNRVMVLECVMRTTLTATDLIYRLNK